jgi:putative Ca2+/H+ antiporter (TMEM165/GDT1 family)
VNLVIAATVFGVVVPAELPDKTFIASLVMGSRFAALPVWVGASLAFIVHAAIAVTVGGLLTLLPHRVVEIIVAVVFASGAVYLLFGREEHQEHAGAAAARRAATHPARVGLTAFAVIFIAEWGDITQILIANLAARYRDPVSVFVGGAVALCLVATIGVVSGRALPRLVPLELLRKIAGVLFAVFAVISIVQAVRG